MEKTETPVKTIEVNYNCEKTETPGPSTETTNNCKKRKLNEAERRNKRLKMIEEKERNFFNFVRDEDKEESSDAPLDFDAELQIYHKMRAIVVQEMKKHFETPSIRDRLLRLMKNLTAEEFEEKELHFYLKSLQHPGVLEYEFLRNGNFSVYLGRGRRRHWNPECINGSYEVDPTTLSDPPPEDPLENYNI